MNMSLLETNISIMQQRSPNLARRLISATVPPHCAVKTARNGMPVLMVDKVTFHSQYDPQREGERIAEKFIDDNSDQKMDSLVIFGLGFAYHISPLLNHANKITVIEPRLEVIKAACEHIDLGEVLKKVKIVTDMESTEPGIMQGVFLEHKPSVAVNRDVYEKVVRHINHNASNHPFDSIQTDAFKIMVVSPIYGGSLPIARYCYEALSNLGHDVVLFDSSMFDSAFQKLLQINMSNHNSTVLHDLFLHLISEMIVATCVDDPPDIVLSLAQAPVSAKALERLRQMDITTAFWFVEDYLLMDYWQNYAPLYDFYFTIQDGSFFDELKKCGAANYYYLPVAAAPVIHRTFALSEDETRSFGSEISFIGSGYYNREQFFSSLLDYDFKIWGDNWNQNVPLWKHVQRNGSRITTEESVKIFNSSKVNINLHSSVCHKGINPDGDFTNPRTFEIASCGAFQLVDYRSSLNKHFSLDSEVVCYRDLAELRSQIDFFLSHPEERLNIAQNARNRILKDHTYEKRMQEMIAFIQLRKPALRSLQQNKKIAIHNKNSFCEDYPEAIETLNRLKPEISNPDLDSIINAIASKQGGLTYPDALFCLINEFKNKFNQVKA